MARPKRYATEAEKQKAYRDRKKGLDLGKEEPVCQTARGDSDVVTSGVDSRLPWPLNPNKSPRWGDGVDHYIAPTEEEKDAMNRLGLEKSRILREERKKK
jgi:hypothetical protein